MSDRPPVNYDQRPTTFVGLLAAAMGQKQREADLGPLPDFECVIVTSKAMLDLFEIVAELRERVGMLEARLDDQP